MCTRARPYLPRGELNRVVKILADTINRADTAEGERFIAPLREKMRSRPLPPLRLTPVPRDVGGIRAPDVAYEFSGFRNRERR